MIRLLSDTKNLTKGTPYGFGVDENTALVITHGDTNNITGKASQFSPSSSQHLP